MTPPVDVPSVVPIAVLVASAATSSAHLGSSSRSAASSSQLLEQLRSCCLTGPQLIPVQSPSIPAPAARGSQSRSRFCHPSGTRSRSRAQSATRSRSRATSSTRSCSWVPSCTRLASACSGSTQLSSEQSRASPATPCHCGCCWTALRCFRGLGHLPVGAGFLLRCCTFCCGVLFAVGLCPGVVLNSNFVTLAFSFGGSVLCWFPYPFPFSCV